MESVIVLLDGKEFIINKENPCDIKPLGETKRAAKKAGRRLMTRQEYELIAKLPSRWDADLKGWWFTFETPSGEPVEIFFHAEKSVSEQSGQDGGEKSGMTFLIWQE